MKKSFRPFFVLTLSVLCAAVFAGSWVFAEASAETGDVSAKTSVSSPSTLLLTDDFTAAAGTLVTAAGWSNHSGTSNFIPVASPGLSYSGYAGSGVGNAASLTTTGEDVSRTVGSTVSSGSLYAAFMVNVTSSQAAGDYVFHYLTFGNNATYRGRVFVRKDAVNNTYAFGLSRGGASFVYTPSTYVNGSTHLIVVKYTFVAGAANDTVQLFVDPTPGGAEPSATLTADAEATADPANLDAIALRQGTAANAPNLQVDGIRVATTWAEAVSSGTPAPEPNGKVDLNGDGRTDYLIVRPNGGAGATALAERRDGRSRVSQRERIRNRAAVKSNLQGGGSPILWYGLNSNDFGFTGVAWGDSDLDEPLTADFDGDGSDDITVWRPALAEEFAYFYSINSSDYTFRSSAFGQLFDNPYVVGDYDGDGVDDPAVFRCPETPGTCYFYYRASTNPDIGIYAIAFGSGQLGDLLPFVGDFNGDGLNDFAVQAAAPSNPENGIFYIGMNGSFDVTGVEWGLLNDFLVSGDFDGDGKSDITVTRMIDGTLWWYVLEQDGGTQFVPWGQDFDFEAPGDYDGDGRDDFAIYRWNDTDAFFWVQPSNGDTHFGVPWGQPGDYPISFFFVQ